MMMDDRRYLLGLIREGEHQQQDFKYRVEDAVKLARSVSAFANTDGGRLLIGVRDDGVLAGVRSEEEIYVMHQAAYRHCRPEASIRFDTFHAEGRTIVVATVPRAEHRPVMATDEEGRRRAYIRIKDENIVASPVHLAIWREEESSQDVAFTYGDDERRLMGAFREGEWVGLNPLVKRTRLPRPKVIVMLARCCRYGLATWRMEDHRFEFALT
jgi:hypothetical protein